jgi:hypothetical protein
MSGLENFSGNERKKGRYMMNKGLLLMLLDGSERGGIAGGWGWMSTRSPSHEPPIDAEASSALEEGQRVSGSGGEGTEAAAIGHCGPQQKRPLRANDTDCFDLEWNLQGAKVNGTDWTHFEISFFPSMQYTQLLGTSTPPKKKPPHKFPYVPTSSLNKKPT